MKITLSIPKMLSGANAFEINDIQGERNREPVLTERPECSKVTLLHCWDSLPLYQFATDTKDATHPDDPRGFPSLPSPPSASVLA
jgi:hypothetical protein